MSVKKRLPALRILIVEDNVDIAENIAEYLEVQCHVLDFAMDGIGGLHLALTQDFDAIVLDIMIPDTTMMFNSTPARSILLPLPCLTMPMNTTATIRSH